MKFKPLAVLLVLECAQAYAAVADDIRALMEQGQFAQAYQLGQRNVDQLGEPVFDFYYGIAALDAGVPGEGVLALERYVLAYPDNRNARFNLARGYYILGEDQRARDEFEALRTAAQAQESSAIERYLDAIQARQSRYMPSAGVWIEGGLGNDGNITSGIDGQSVDIAGLAPFALVANSVSRRAEGGFYTFAAGANGSWPVAAGVALYGGANLDGRNYFDASRDQFDQLNYAVNGGVSRVTGRNLFRVSLAAQQQRVYRQNYLLTYDLNADWTHQHDQFDRFNVGLLYGRQDYSDMRIHALLDKSDALASSGAELRDADRWGVSANWTHVFGASWQPVWILSASYGGEENRAHRPDFSRNVYTLRGQLSFTPAPRWAAAVGATYFVAEHQGRYGAWAGAVARRDANIGADAVVSYRIDRHWSVCGEARWNSQDSNIGLFDYSRAVVAAKVRYEIH